MLEKELIVSQLQDHPWRGSLHVFDTLGSTNTQAKTLAKQGAPEGTVVIADEQTGGRGRMGRSFDSQKGRGLYFSLLLRPALPPDRLLHITPMAAVAACNAVEQVAGVRPGVKWINDLILGERKLAGILTESKVDWQSGLVEYLVIGIGINCGHSEDEFPPGLNAVSLKMATEQEISREALAAALIRELALMAGELISGKERWLRQYAGDCLTVGKEVRILRSGSETPALALGIDEDGGLLVRYQDGSEGCVACGEVSVRGKNGYI